MICDELLVDQLSGHLNSSRSKERLLISECSDGLDLSLYISSDVISQIQNVHPIELITEGKYSEFCLILEGVSHFLYIVWNASHQRQVTLFEMELQAEIDKFILLQSFIDYEPEKNDAAQIGNWLFESHTFDEMLSEVELTRYEQANYYAGKYCLGLQQQFQLTEKNKDLLNELRRFYRFSRENKVRYINRLH